MKRKIFLKSSIIAAGLTVVPEMVSANPATTQKSFRFAFISDIHVMPGKVAEEGMAKCLQYINMPKPKVDFIIMGGDAIYDSLKATKEYTALQPLKIYSQERE